MREGEDGGSDASESNENDVKRQRTSYHQLSPYVHASCSQIVGVDAVQAYCRLVKSDLSSKASHFITWFARLAESIHPLKLHEQPDDETVDMFKRFVCDQQRSRTPLYMDKLRKLGLHERYAEAVEHNHTEEEESLYHLWNKSLPRAAMEAWRHLTSKKLRVKQFMLLLDYLYRTSGTRDLSACGNISLEAAANHCRRVDATAFHHLLAHTGFQHSLLALQQSLGNRDLLRANHERLALPTQPYNFTKYLMLRRILGRDPHLAVHMSRRDIQQRLEGCDGATLCTEFGMRPQAGILVQLFRMLSAELEARGACQMRNDLLVNLPYTISGESLWKRLDCVSEWMHQVLEQIEANFEREGTTGVNTKRFQQRTRETVARQMQFLLEFAAARSEDAEDINAANRSASLRHFLSSCTSDDVEAATLAFMRAGTVRNDRVKSVNSTHSASKRCSDMVRLWTIGLSHLVPSTKTTKLAVGKLLKKVENERVPAHGQTRRYYNDEEVASMFEVCRDDAKLTLVLTILKEVGLRNGALNLLQYYSLVDEHCQPRHSCNVREKAGARRVFITSENLKNVIRTYYAQLDARLPEGVTRADVFIFNEQDPMQPLTNQTLRTWLTRLGEAANVTGVHVHPHAFRHTLVCNLMKAGNSLEAVSKYMGHKSVSTTNSHYWVATMEDLHERINNPTSDKFQEMKAQESAKDDEIRLLRVKKDFLLQLVGSIEGVLQTHCDGDVQAVLSDINALHPNLPEILERIQAPET